jgi:hypothetical protein
VSPEVRRLLPWIRWAWVVGEQCPQRGANCPPRLLPPIVEVDLATQNTGVVPASEFGATASSWCTDRCRGHHLGAGIAHNERGASAEASSIGQFIGPRLAK